MKTILYLLTLSLLCCPVLNSTRASASALKATPEVLSDAPVPYPQSGLPASGSAVITGANEPVRFARGQRGMVATGSTYATAAAVQILAAGGNAMDAAAAACFAIMVTDPANTSLGGRAQILLRLRDGRVVALDGATEAPAVIRPLRAGEDRSGYEVAPVPGAPAALEIMVRRYGRLKLSDVMQPAIALADRGFNVPPRLADTWERARAALQRDAGAAQHFLKSDGSAYRAGELFRQPALARVLSRIAESGTAALYRGEFSRIIARDVAGHNGFIRQSDLRGYRAEEGRIVRATYRSHQVVSAGGRAWGNTLAEMLNILDHFKIGSSAPTAEEVEILARVMAQSLADRPQEIGTLRPKADGLPLARISSRAFAAGRAAMIRKKLPPGKAPVSERDHDTTHMSVMDAEGNAVALTTSIGPSFGARVVTPELGFLYAHSYRMRSAPQPRARDLTEMTPTIVFRDNRPLLAIGAAGSERIPTAILQVISNVIDRGWSLDAAVRAPRLFCLDERLRLHDEFPDTIFKALGARGFAVEPVTRDAARHLGLVHAVQYDPATGEYSGAADHGDSGSAAGPPGTGR